MARAAESDEPIEVEVRAAARALDDVVNVQAPAATARLAAPPGTAADLTLNGLPFDARGGRAAGHADRVRPMLAEAATT